MLEVAGETGGGPGVGPHGDGRAGIDERLQVPLGLHERLAVPCGVTALSHALHELRLADALDLAFARRLREERVVEELGASGIHERRDLARQRGHVADPTIGQQLEQLIIDVEVANRMGDHVGPGPKKSLGVFQVEEVARDPQVLLVRTFDDRAIDAG